MLVNLLIYNILGGGKIVVKANYEEGIFGAYFVKLIKQHNYSQADFAKDIRVSKIYIVDVFHGRVKAPILEIQEKIVIMLGFEEYEKIDFFSKATIGRNELPKDIVDFLSVNQSEIDNIRERMRVLR